jgi:bla regulator protein BlaR1
VNSYLASFGPALANHLWQSTAFAAAAWLLTILLRKNSARVRYGIWLVASIKFLIPFSLLIALGGLLPKPAQPVAPAVYAAMRVTEQPFADISAGPTTSVVHTLTLPQRIAADILAVFVVLWLVGGLTVLIIWFQRWRKASACLREAVPPGHGRELEILRRLEARVDNGRRSPLRLRLSVEPSEPSIFGIFRSVFVWPQRLSERLEDEHIEAIMAHELAHARRFDNATAALHMLVEALFWFHPLVWWMERRMIEERERACDEVVIGLGGSANAYAEGVLRTCRFCIESPLPCVTGVTGADLKKRVVNIVTARTLMRMTLSKKLLLGAASLCVVAAPVLLGQMNTLNDWEKAAGGKMALGVA